MVDTSDLVAGVFANGSVHTLEFIEDEDEVKYVNEPSEPLSINIYGHIHTFILIAVNSAVLWYLLNTFIWTLIKTVTFARYLLKLKSTFLNYLVLLDCCNALAHASFLIQGHL